MQEQLRMQMLAGIITESQYKVKLGEIRVNAPNDLSDPKIFKRFLDRIPNENYFFIAEEMDWDFEDEGYNWEAFDDEQDSDLVDYFYDPIFDNELKGKPGIEGNDFSEFQDADQKKDKDYNEGYSGERESMLANKIIDIITAYKKKYFSNKIK